MLEKHLEQREEKKYEGLPRSQDAFFSLYDAELEWYLKRKDHASKVIKIEAYSKVECHAALELVKQIVKHLSKLNPEISYAAGGFSKPQNFPRYPRVQPSTSSPAPTVAWEAQSRTRFFGSDVTPLRARTGYDVIFWFGEIDDHDALIKFKEETSGDTRLQVTGLDEITNPWESVGDIFDDLGYLKPPSEENKNKVYSLVKQLNLGNLRGTLEFPIFPETFFNRSKIYLHPASTLPLVETFDPTPLEEELLFSMNVAPEAKSTTALSFIRKWLPSDEAKETAIVLISDAGSFDDKLGIIETANALSHTA